MHLRRALLASVLAFGALLAVALAGDELQVVRDKAVELTKDHSARAEKIVALQAFVRDEIREVATQWG
ncbi:MAG: hypothetical protein PHR35_02600 [Kiritimatiellae bacterium]|nr:hypothetical protein [Kiritimatiellia bacterium]